MSNQTPNATHKTLIIIVLCCTGMMLFALTFLFGWWVGRSQAGGPQFPPPGPLVLVETQMPRQVIRTPLKPKRVTGVGVMLARDRKTHKWTISRTFPNSPAARAGIQNGTLLEAVDGHPVEHLRVEEVTALLTGATGSRLTLDLLNRELTETNRLELIRIDFVNGVAVTNGSPQDIAIE